MHVEVYDEVLFGSQLTHKFLLVDVIQGSFLTLHDALLVHLK